jgi:hypothetical protein
VTSDEQDAAVAAFLRFWQTRIGTEVQEVDAETFSRLRAAFEAGWQGATRYREEEGQRT